MTLVLCSAIASPNWRGGLPLLVYRAEQLVENVRRIPLAMLDRHTQLFAQPILTHLAMIMLDGRRQVNPLE